MLGEYVWEEAAQGNGKTREIPHKEALVARHLHYTQWLLGGTTFCIEEISCDLFPNILKGMSREEKRSRAA